VSNRGGRRPGAGRKRGVPNKRTASDIAKAEATGIMPKDVLLTEMRHHYAEFERIRDEGEPDDPEQREEWHRRAAEALALARAPAIAAAPYFHAKLQSHRVGGDPDLPAAIRIEDLSNSQLDALIERIEAALGILPTAIAADEEADDAETKH